MKKPGVSAKRWLQIDATLFESEAFRTLPAKALKLWIDMRTQYFGNNNGHLLVTLRAFKRRGWNSTSQLLKARDELIGRGLIRRTKYNGPNAFHRATLYAFTDKPTAESEKHDVAGANASHAYLNWTAAKQISDFRQEETNVTSLRKATSPPAGKQAPETFPPAGKQHIGRKTASTLTETNIQPDSARFPAGGNTSNCSTSVMSQEGSMIGSVVNGSQHPLAEPSPRAARLTAKRSARASRTKA